MATARKTANGNSQPTIRAPARGPRRQPDSGARLRPVVLDDGDLAWVEPPRHRPLRTILRTLRLAVFRYRAQLAPVALITAVWILGAVVYPVGHGVRTVAVLGVLATAAAAAASVRWCTRPATRAYLVVCLLAATGWLAAAARLGPDQQMAAVLWLVGCAVAGPWWWRHRIRGVPASSDASTEVEVWNEKVACPGGPLPGATLTGISPVRGGWTATIALVRGKQTTDDAVAKTRQIASAYGREIDSVAVEPTADGNAAHASLLMLDANPLHQIQLWPGPSALDLGSGVAAIGIYADGARAPYRFWRYGSGPVHDLIAGTTDSGKSRLCDQLLALERHSGLVTSWVIDPQSGQSLPDWVSAVDWFAPSVEEGLRLLRAARAVMYARNRHLARVAWVDDKGRTRRGRTSFDPRLAMPLLSITIEEAHRVLAVDSARKLAEEIAVMSRKCGIKLRFVVQVPLLDQLGGSSTLRDMLAGGNVIVLRTANPLTGQVAFQGALPVAPNKLPRQLPDGSSSAGLGFILGPADRPATMRAYHVDDPHYWATTGEPAELDVLSLDAAGEEYATRVERAEAEEGSTDEGSADRYRGGGAPCQAPTEGRRPGESDSPRDPPTDREPESAVAAVLAVLADGEAQRGQLIAETGYSPRAVTDALKALVSDGRVCKIAHGRYTLTDRDEHRSAD